jgi:nitrate reductase alpha subunit
MAQFGVSRGLTGDYPSSFSDADSVYTPAWQEKYTGISAGTVIQFAREWYRTAEATKGKCCIIIGTGVNQWYHSNLTYRAAALAEILTGCIGVNGGGMNHYVGQEKLAPFDSWEPIMAARDWQKPVRMQQTPIWHYINSDQWRYDGNQADYNTVPDNDFSSQHTADLIVKSVRNGWMPFFPQYNRNNFEIVKDAIASGAKDEKNIQQYIIGKLKTGELKYAVADPDDEFNFPRIWYIWRGNAILASAKGHEYSLKHYLGTHNSVIADEAAIEYVKEINWREPAPEGKMDLVVDLNFRMDTSALYSDIVLPSASWYEKSDLNTTDLHSYIHPLGAAVPPVYESKSDWQIFREIARVTSEAAKKHLPGLITDVVNMPLDHDTKAEMSQLHIKDWFTGECDPIPGKTMHNIVTIERDYTRIYEKFNNLGRNVRKNIAGHGIVYKCDDFYDLMLKNKGHVNRIDGEDYPSLTDDVDVINAVLFLSSVTNGTMSTRAFKSIEENTGIDFSKVKMLNNEVSLTYSDIMSQPRRLRTSPIWSGLMNNGRAYSGFTINTEFLVPWRTLTGRQHLYLDHEAYILFGENLPAYKPPPLPGIFGDLRNSVATGKAKVLNCLTPHGKWHIHTTFGDTQRMLTLSRGIEPCWLSEADAMELGIQDNDWVEVFNDNGVYCTRAVVSARIPKGVCIVYHAPERTYSAPKSQIRKIRGGGHNSLTRLHFKPNLLAGGYGQFTYHQNYWGPVGVTRDTYVLVQKMEKLEF